MLAKVIEKKRAGKESASKREILTYIMDFLMDFFLTLNYKKLISKNKKKKK